MNRRAGFPAPVGFGADVTKPDCAARGLLQTAAAGHGTGTPREGSGCAIIKSRHALVSPACLRQPPIDPAPEEPVRERSPVGQRAKRPAALAGRSKK